jgi:hypothetical protein
VIATQESSIAARLARAVLEWLDVSGSLSQQHDLVLVRMPPGLDNTVLPEQVAATSGVWKLATVEGDLALRVALSDANGGRVLAFTFQEESAFQEDLRERAVLRRTITPQSRHIFSALVGIESTALDDERFSQPIRDIFAEKRRDALLAAIKTRTWLHLIRESDATAVLCAAAFGFDDRYAERRPGELWASWLQAPPLATPALTPLALEMLRSRYPLYAKVLADAPDHDLRREFSRVAHHAYSGDRQLLRLARDTAIILRERDPALLETLLRDNEAAYVAAGSPDVRESMLANAASAKLRSLAIAIRSAVPPTSEDVEELGSFVYADAVKRDALVRLARLARGLLAFETILIPQRIRGFADVFRDEMAWLDRAARRAREIAVFDTEFAETQTKLVNAWYALRDQWNGEFAALLVRQWSKLFAFPGKDAPLVLSDVLKYAVRPDLAERKTLLIVLDGCDVPTYLEICAAFEAAGVVPSQFELALSPIPTVTSHARRAIFGGGIPNDKIGDDDRAADASGDDKAFHGKNALLDGYSRKLYLKGELGDGGAELVRALKDVEHAPQLLAVVFNDVDDAIASKEHSVLSERTLERCTKAFRETLINAYECGWRIVLTADHGHTPYRQPDIKASTGHARFSLLKPSETAPAGTVVFETGVGMPYRVAALSQLGSHAGPQHIGYHGGVSLEEMLVPLAVYDAKATQSSAVLPPTWWDDAAARPPREARDTSRSEKVAVAPTSSVRTQARAVLASDPRLLAMFERIYEAGALDSSALGTAVGIPPPRVRLYVTGLIAKIRDAGLEPPIEIEDSPLVFRYKGLR